MTDQQQQHPLHGVGLEALLTELHTYYGWQILAEQIPINCFKSNPDTKSCVKFLMKTDWARHRLEAFYLYKFKGLDRPSDEQHLLLPRLREVLNEQVKGPIKIDLGDPEFFDDPASGPVFPSKKEVSATKISNKVSSKPSRRARSEILIEPVADTVEPSRQESATETESEAETKPSEANVKNPDPWAKWKSKNAQQD